MKVKGLQVSPAELEAVLVLHPKVADAAVIGVPDEGREEAPQAYVVKKENVSEREIMEFLGGKVSSVLVIWSIAKALYTFNVSN